MDTKASRKRKEKSNIYIYAKALTNGTPVYGCFGGKGC